MALPSDIEKIEHTPTVFVVFGATGDLSRKKIFPSFYELFKNGLLPKKLKIIAASRTKHSSDDFHNIIRETTPKADTKSWKNFTSQIEYLVCDIAENINLDKVKKALSKNEKEMGVCSKRIFYLAVAPNIYEKAFENLGKHKLNLGCQIHNNHARLVIEKPFGYDYESAQILNSKLEKYFSDEQIFRIDHFLGKETVQNIFALRFANEIFDPVWNSDYVDNVQITIAERIGIEKRGNYYETTGALRDVVQNHMLQLLTIATMEKPQKFERDSIRPKKVDILNSLIKLSEKDVETSTVRGQYEGYLDEENVNPNSQTETYSLVKLFIDSQRWKNVPFYLRTGKKLTGKVSSIIFSFKEKGHKIFENFWEKPIPNHITIQIEPNEGVGLRLAAKKPGLTTALEPVDMEFCYRTSFNTPNPSAYERLLMDVIVGDQTLFLGQIGPSWKFIDPIRKVWDKGRPKLTKYQQGSWGPKEADELIAKDNREWLAPLLTICKI